MVQISMLHCDICGQEELSEEDMKSHLLLAHLEPELSCPLCCLSGVTYDQMSLHIDTAHFEEVEESCGGGQHLGLRFSENLELPYAKRDQGNFEATTNVDLKVSQGAESCFSPEKPTQRSFLLSPQHSLETRNSACVPSLADTNCSTQILDHKSSLLGVGQQNSSSPTLASSPAQHGHLECPFCGHKESSFQDIELHVEAKHTDLLETPTKGNAPRLYECPLCELVCSSCQILQEHVDLHLEESSIAYGTDVAGSSRDLTLARQVQEEESRKEQEEFQKLQKQYGLDNSGGYKEQSLQNMERAVARGRMQPYEYHTKKAEMMESLAFGVDDGRTKTSGIIEVLSRYFQNCGQDVKRVWLCSSLDHFNSSLGDRGWGCGYRNFQMLLSSLLKNALFENCLQGMLMPCIPKIQSMIENAWKEGFDPQGASHFNYKLRGTKAWIGASEIYSLLTSLSLKCRIIDFHKATGHGGTHPLLFQWVLNYYSSGVEGFQKVVCTSKSPIYLQHQGHSRAIVGIEEKKNGAYCLLVFDPGCSSQHMQKLLKQDISGSQLKILRRFAGSLKHKQYQIVAVEDVLPPQEKSARRQASKIFTAERIP